MKLFCTKNPYYEKILFDKSAIQSYIHKRMSIFFISLMFVFSSWFAGAGGNEERKSFICGYKMLAEYVNSLITLDYNFIMYQIDRLKRNKITEEGKVNLVMTLMRYRLLPLDEDEHRTCRFFSYLCVPEEHTDALRNFATQYLQNNPTGPESCYIHYGGGEKQFPLFSENCLMAIEKRIRPIPVPMAIAQAGLESAWGRSFFSENGHNFFGGQVILSSSTRVRNHPKCIPARRNTRNCVFKFESPEIGFFIYTQMLNSKSPYIGLRELRYESEMNNDTPCEMAQKMAQGLSRYALDPEYVRKVQTTIRAVCRIMEDC